MVCATVAGLAAGSAQARGPAFDADLETGRCHDAGGREGLNLGYLGRCGDLRGVSLAGRDLRGVDLESANLTDVDLRGARLDGAILNGARLDGANLEGASLYRAQLRGTSFVRADLEHADLSDAFLWRADLRKADVRGARLDQFPTGLRVELNRFDGAIVDGDTRLHARLTGIASRTVLVDATPAPSAIH